MDEVKDFFCQFPNPWAFRVSGMGGYTSKCEKSKNHCTLLYRVQDPKISANWIQTPGELAHAQHWRKSTVTYYILEEEKAGHILSNKHI